MKILIFNFWNLIFSFFVYLPQNELVFNRKLKREIKKIWNVEVQSLKFENVSLENFYSQSQLYKLLKNEETIGYIFDVKCNSCHVGGCKNIQNGNTENAAYEFFRFHLFLNRNFEILKISIYDYEATHGQEIANRFWLRQFVGFDGTQKLRYAKEVDAISGATVSSEALIKELHYLLNFKSQVLE